MKRCEKCYRKLEEESTSEDPDLCKGCFHLAHRFDRVRLPYTDDVPNGRDHWA